LEIGAKGVTPLETNAAVDPLVDVFVFRKLTGAEHAFVVLSVT
jgi:hypothetical protein